MCRYRPHLHLASQILGSTSPLTPHVLGLSWLFTAVPIHTERLIMCRYGPHIHLNGHRLGVHHLHAPLGAAQPRGRLLGREPGLQDPGDCQGEPPLMHMHRGTHLDNERSVRFSRSQMVHCQTENSYSWRSQPEPARLLRGHDQTAGRVPCMLQPHARRHGSGACGCKVRVEAHVKHQQPQDHHGSGPCSSPACA